MSGGSEEAVVEWAIHLMRQRYRRSTAGPSHLRSRAAGPSRLHAQPKVVSELHSRFQDGARARTPDEVSRHARYHRVQDVPATPPPESASDDLPEPEELMTAIAAAGASARPVSLSPQGVL